MTKKEAREQRLMQVAQSNELVRGCKNMLTTREQNVVYYLVSKIKPDDADIMTVHTTARELCEVFGINQSGKNHDDLYKALKTLADKSVWAGDKGSKVKLMRWIDTYEIDHSTGKIAATLSQSVKPFLIGLVKKGSYTQAELQTYLALRSKYAKRLYELLKSHVRMKYPDAYAPAAAEYGLDELKRLLDAEGYKLYKHVRERILDPAMAEINAVSDIDAGYEPKKAGRAVSAIAFAARLKPPDGRASAMATAAAKLDAPRPGSPGGGPPQA